MRFIITRLLNFINTTSKKDINYTIALYLLQNLNDVASLSIYDIADACFVSPASVSRFAKALGYRSFSMLKEDALQQSIIVSNVAKLPQFDQGLDKYIENLEVSLDFFRHIDQTKIDQLVDWLIRYDKVCLLGIQFSGSIAMQMQGYLNLLHKWVEAPLTISLQHECLEEFDQESLVILFTSRGNYYSAYLENLIQVKNKGAKVVMITQNPKTNSLADLVILTGSMENIEYAEYTMYLMMSYIVNCYQKRILAM